MKHFPFPWIQHTNGPVIQGSVTPNLKSAEKVIEHVDVDVDTQEVDWLDVILVEIPPNMTSKMSKAYPLNQHI